MVACLLASANAPDDPASPTNRSWHAPTARVARCRFDGVVSRYAYSLNLPMKLKLILLFAALLGTAAFSPLFAADQDPKAITQFAPDYPGEMQHAGREGAVLVAFRITSHGDVADAVVVSSTQRTFEASTLAAVKQWKFAPGMQDGIAVSTSARLLITFMDPAHEVSAT